MNVLVFVDTNVLLYAIDAADPAKQRAAGAWRARLWQERAGRVSFQVLHEFYAQVTRKTRERGSLQKARQEVRDLTAWRPVASDVAILERAWALQDRYRLPFWDALIVASALSVPCRFLLSEDFQHGQDLDGLVVVSPFRAEPGSL